MMSTGVTSYQWAASANRLRDRSVKGGKKPNASLERELSCREKKKKTANASCE